MKSTKMKIWALAFAFGATQVVGAQTLHLQGSFKNADAAEMNLYAKGMGDTIPAVKLNAESSHFEGQVTVSPSGFYSLYGNNKGAQLIVPLYLPNADRTPSLKVRMEDGCPVVETGKDNQTLSAFNVLTYVKGREFWTQGKEMNAPVLKAFLKNYAQAADSIAGHYNCSAPVREYLKLWAYVTTYANYTSWTQVSGRPSDEFPFPLTDVVEEPYRVLDTPMAAFFPNTPYIVFGTLPKAGLEERMSYLQAHYSNEDIRKAVGSYILDDYVRHFDFNAGDFDQGLATLEAATAKYGMDTKYVEKFEARKSSMKGKSFPTGVTLVDADGQKMDFSRFKGDYVYVDLWASWCGPCCKEVPFLQELEANLQNKNVKFLSISLDKNEKAWKDKMKALNMEGDQWLSPDDSLAEALNIKGIPYFLIYDKDGNLYRGNAPRPSQPELKTLLEGLH
ncbi:MAG: TlpA family protein disulfide reductase [Paraprevotella sp.]|nr:TlpA family protein disulfide reductase [Paraprevotella sp.]